MKNWVIRKNDIKDQLFSLPNILSIVRILLIPVIIVSFIKDYYKFTAVVVAFSGFTDFLDGLIARKFNMITPVGKILDPFADKLTQFCVAVCLVYLYSWFWVIVCILFVKELTMGILGLIIMKHGKLLKGAKLIGKISTFFLDVAVCMLIFFHNTIQSIYVNFLIGTSAVLLITSLILYIPEFLGVLKIAKEEEAAK